MKVGTFEVNEIPEDEITAKIDHWYIDDKSYDGYTVLRGYVFHDTRMRWRDGMVFRSSALVGDKFNNLQEGDTVRTLNSRYLLGRPITELHH